MLASLGWSDSVVLVSAAAITVTAFIVAPLFGLSQRWRVPLLLIGLGIAWLAIPVLFTASRLCSSEPYLAFHRFFAFRNILWSWVAVFTLGHLLLAFHHPVKDTAAARILAPQRPLSVVFVIQILLACCVLPALVGVGWRGDNRLLPLIGIASATVAFVFFLASSLGKNQVFWYRRAGSTVILTALFAALSWSASEIVYRMDVGRAVAYIETLTRTLITCHDHECEQAMHDYNTAPEKLPRHLGPWSTPPSPNRLVLGSNWTIEMRSAEFRPIGDRRLLFFYQVYGDPRRIDGNRPFQEKWGMGYVRMQGDRPAEAAPEFAFPVAVNWIISCIGGQYSQLTQPTLRIPWQIQQGEELDLTRVGELALSPDGRFIVFSTEIDPNTHVSLPNTMIYRFDRQTKLSLCVSLGADGGQPDGQSKNPSISGDGRFVAFESIASNLVQGDTNRVADVFVHDCFLRRTIRVSVDSTGRQAVDHNLQPILSRDGQFVAFTTYALNLTPGRSVGAAVLIHDRSSGLTDLVSVGMRDGEDGGQYPSISADGRFVVWSNNDNIFVRDRMNMRTEAVTNNKGVPGTHPIATSPCLSADGRFVVYISMDCQPLPGEKQSVPRVFLHDRTSGRTELISDGPLVSQKWGCYNPTVSDDGTRISFVGTAASIEKNSRTIQSTFVYDQKNQRIWLVSIDSRNNIAAGDKARISGDGDTIAFLREGRINVRVKK